ncbi:hypothetical protein [Halioxenophilus sp. WMMB6]|uniref:energy transducer TonB n=1 Tax=Halioxenophilus sp. WMMB6 TaxID=3073815 RepID=UPI00295F1B88|nr:hypothetical protein [Halioxenophilus sp. WMMB6]
MLRLFFSTLLLISFSNLLFAEEFSPAHFGEAEEIFFKKLSLPKLPEGETLLIRCSSKLSRRGGLRELTCFTNRDELDISHDYVKAIDYAARYLKIEPAVVNGKTISVYFNFALTVQQKDGRQYIELFNNHLYNYKTLGKNYISAQRYDFSPWQCNLKSKMPVNMSMEVSASGEVTNIQSSRSFENNFCARRVRSVIEQSQFIPAMKDGQPQPSTYVETFY